MKKILLSLSMVALFAITANAQEPQKGTAGKNPNKKEVVNPDGTTSVVEEKKEDPGKKSGTRMAINEKGTTGTKGTTAKKETAKEEKTESTSPVSKPH